MPMDLLKQAILYMRDNENGEKNFRLLDWEMSYAVNFWMCIYH